MPWQKSRQVVKQAKSDPEDLSVRFYRSDAAAMPPNVLRAEIRIEFDGDPTPEIIDLPLDATPLTPPQRAQVRALLTVLRNEALKRAGYTNTQ